jgi:hypothetical protein
MFFNPIFINPQNFMGPAGTENTKKNKLSYLFSDIIKNSLGKYAAREKKKTDSAEAELVCLKTVNNEIILSSDKMPELLSAKTVKNDSFEHLLFEMRKVVNSVINRTNNSTSSIKHNNSDIKENSTLIDDVQLNEILVDLINFLNNAGYKISVQETELSSNSKLPLTNAGNKDLNVLVDTIQSLISSGERVDFNVSIGNKIISINTEAETKTTQIPNTTLPSKNSSQEKAEGVEKPKINPPVIKDEIIHESKTSIDEKNTPKNQTSIVKENSKSISPLKSITVSKPLPDIAEAKSFTSQSNNPEINAIKISFKKSSDLFALKPGTCGK